MNYYYIIIIIILVGVGVKSETSALSLKIKINSFYLHYKDFVILLCVIKYIYAFWQYLHDLSQ